MRLLSCLAVMLSLWAPNALAVQPDEIMPDTALEARARTLSKELRCMVCQNQSIDDSDAPLARDLRLLVRERLKEGDSDGQVIDFLVARYGEFVLLRPRLSLHTAVLWLAPVGLLGGGALALLLLARRRSQRDPHSTKPDGGALSEEEQARLAKLMTSENA
jgi:cytochrome c-type biogenesis protein CcmH